MLELDERGLLPPGDYRSDWKEFFGPFCESFEEGREHRRRLLVSCHAVLLRLRAEMVDEAVIGGSFVTDKPLPPDIDVIYDIPFGHPHSHWRDRELANVASDPTRRAAFKRSRKIDLRTTKDGVYHKGRVIPLLDAYHRTKPDEVGNSEPRGVVILELGTLPDAHGLGEPGHEAQEEGS